MEKTSTFENLPEQRLYANILFYLNLIGLFILLTGFTLYLTGVITPIVPLEELPRFWSLSLNEYIERIKYAHRMAVDIKHWVRRYRSDAWYSGFGISDIYVLFCAAISVS